MGKNRISKRESNGNEAGGGGGGAFITQKGEKIVEVKKEIAELEQLLAGSTQTSQSTLLLKKRKEMKEVDEALELMKDDYKRRMDECEERRLQFELKQAKLREQVLKFEKFIQENDSKRMRAESKAKLERKLYEERCKDLQSLTIRIHELEMEERKLQSDLIQKNCFRDYLESIVEEGDHGYEEIGDILNRHRTLVDANRDLMSHARSREGDVDNLTYRFQLLKTERQNQLLVSNSYIQDLQKQLEHLRSTAKLEMDEKNHLEDKQKNVSRELSQVGLGIRNIYNRCIATMVNTKLSSFGPAGGVGGGSSITVNNTSSSGGGGGGGGIGGGGTGTMGSGGGALAALIESLDHNIEIMHGRMVDLLEITREYKADSSGTSAGGVGGYDLRDGSTASVFTGNNTPTSRGP